MKMVVYFRTNLLWFPGFFQSKNHKYQINLVLEKVNYLENTIPFTGMSGSNVFSGYTRTWSYFIQHINAISTSVDKIALGRDY